MTYTRKNVRAAVAIPCSMWLLLAASAPAAYRNVDSGSRGATQAETNEFANADAERFAARASFIRNGEQTDLVSRGGRFAELHVDALEEVAVTLLKPGVAEGTTVFAYTVHGGRINGKVTDSIRVLQGGRIEFVFRAGKYFGNYPVVLRHEGKEDALNFWVGAARLDATTASGVSP